jgi:RNA polymerase sigma-70 factor (ECF subfamily)
MPALPPEFAAARERFLELVRELRPDLHRYCSRLVGSAIDGEDVVQEALAKAYYALGLAAELPPLRPWLLRIAHNTAVDFLRRYDRRLVEPAADLDERAAAEDEIASPEVTRAALSTFVALPVLQRSAVILKDILGFSAEEIAEIAGATVPAVKAALVRGRAVLRGVPRLDPVPWRDRPETSPAERRLLDEYVRLFNARDWDALESLIGEECRLDLVSKAARTGKKGVRGYFGQYAKEDARLAVGRAEGRDVLAVFRPSAAKRPEYIIALEGDSDQVRRIRDWRYVSYLMSELAFEFDAPPGE